MSDAPILVVVDPTAAEQPAVERGARLARALGCDLDLFICHHDPRFAGGRLFAPVEREALRRQALEHQLGYLATLARDAGGDDLEIRTRAAWDAPLAEGIIREVLRREPRFVLKDTHHHSAISRTLFTNTDWQLIRDCPAPLWLVKPGADAPGTVLVAVDPLHEHDKPAELDDRLLATARELAAPLGARVALYHGFDPTPAIARAGAFAMSPTPVPIEEISAKVRAAHESAFTQFIERHGLGQADAHLVAGPPVETLPAIARRLAAGLIVMGAISRGRIKQATIGNTAERVLDHLPCDVLVIRPANFTSAVTFRGQAGDFLALDGA